MKTKFLLLTMINIAGFSTLFSATVSAQCRDPWINNAYRELYNRTPVGNQEVGECYIRLYNNGSWNNYNELKSYIQQFKNTGTIVGFAPATNNNSVMAVKLIDGTVGVSLLSNNSGTIVASGGGNLVASGGGNLVASGGGNLVASGGGNFNGLISSNTPGFGVTGAGYGTQAGEVKRVKASGNGFLVIRR